MWIMTKIGFYSIVEKPKGRICIRSRSVADMIQLQLRIYQDGEVQETLLADYRYRMTITREYFEQEFSELVKFVTYNNFKDEIKKHNKHREMLYHQVWNILRNIEREEESEIEMERRTR